jgi:formyl-CoA transferase
MGGLMSITGMPGQGPMRVGIPIADLTGGIFCAMGILVALLEREVSGEGQWVQSSLLQAQIFMLDFQAARWLVDHEVPPQAGNNHPTSIPTGVFPTSDGHINIAAAGGHMWIRFCEAMEAPQFLKNADYATSESRSKNRDRLNREISEITRKRSSADWVARLNKAGVPSGPIYAMNEVFDDPQVKHLQMVERLETHLRGPIDLTGQPMKLSRTPSHLVVEPPAAGQHTDEILGELGSDAAAIKALRGRGAV